MSPTRLEQVGGLPYFGARLGCLRQGSECVKFFPPEAPEKLFDTDFSQYGLGPTHRVPDRPRLFRALSIQ